MKTIKEIVITSIAVAIGVFGGLLMWYCFLTALDIYLYSNPAIL